VFFGKESEKDSEEKFAEKSSGEKPSEQPQPKPKSKLVRFHCGYCRRDGHKDEFRLGESERLLEVLLAGLHRSDRWGHRLDRCRPGQAAVRVLCSYRCVVWF
jgi:hypothetical protein